MDDSVTQDEVYVTIGLTVESCPNGRESMNRSVETRAGGTLSLMDF